jgi:GMP synthase-like glutamine amidotransferase
LLIHWIQHVTFEGLGTVRAWAELRHHRLVRSLAPTEDFPDPADVEWLVVMGGPMSANDHRRNPWLLPEKRLIEDVIEQGGRVLGICLGAQLVAQVLGGTVRRSSEPEIGWFPVRLTPAGAASGALASLPLQFVAGHWHGDTFDLPPGVASGAESDACANQAFDYDGRVWGLQFHLEWDEAGLGRLVQECAEELVAGRYVQRPDELLERPEHFRDCRALMFGLLDAMAQAETAREVRGLEAHRD